MKKLNWHLIIGILFSFLINGVTFTLLPIINHFHREEPSCISPTPIEVVRMKVIKPEAPKPNPKPKRRPPEFKPKHIIMASALPLKLKLEPTPKPISFSEPEPLIPQIIYPDPLEPAEAASLVVPKRIYEATDTDQYPIKIRHVGPKYPLLAKRLGIDQAYLVMAVQAAFYGLKVGTYHHGDEEQDVRLKYLPQYRRDFDDLMNLKISVKGHGVVPLKEVASIDMKPGFHNIYHYNGKPTVRLTANVQGIQDKRKGIRGFLSNLMGEKMTPVKANGIARQYFDSIKAGYAGARMIAGGLQDETRTSLRELRNAGILALFLIFFILALQFNSFTQPFIIMVTIPFVTLGVIIGLLVSNNPLTFVTLIGLLTLSGIVVNDSLVLIDFINRYWKDHPKQLYLAIIRGCHVRMRPIILTSMTTIFGLAPMAFGLGGKSPFWAPLATAIMWGLAFSTLLILTMVPAYYAILQDVGYVIRHRRRRKAETLKEIEEAFTYKELEPYLKPRDQL